MDPPMLSELRSQVPPLWWELTEEWKEKNLIATYSHCCLTAASMSRQELLLLSPQSIFPFLSISCIQTLPSRPFWTSFLGGGGGLNIFELQKCPCYHPTRVSISRISAAIFSFCRLAMIIVPHTTKFVKGMGQGMGSKGTLNVCLLCLPYPYCTTFSVASLVLCLQKVLGNIEALKCRYPGHLCPLPADSWVLNLWRLQSNNWNIY